MNSIQETQSINSPNHARRFAGTKKLYGDQAFATFEKTHVFVAGIGGVGTWVVEGLARTGIGAFTLVDMDVLAESNINRQLPALTENLGIEKAELMAKRIEGINPNAKVTIIDDFIHPDNAKRHLDNAILKHAGHYHMILDCVDDVPAKIAMALYARFNKQTVDDKIYKIPILMAGGAGGKIDPLRIQVKDLRHTEQDPLLARVRHKLRHEFQINKTMKEKFAITCIYSDEPPIIHKECDTSAGLHCGGYGSAVSVTASVGMVMVSTCLKHLSNIVRSQQLKH